MKNLRWLALLVVAALGTGASSAAEPAWSYYASVWAYFVPGSDNYAQPTFVADRSWLHLEARYNYEARDTTSIWGGYNFSVGDKVTFSGTAMLAGVFGDTSGIAPGYKASLAWPKFLLYSEGEYLFDSDDSEGNFFFAWTEFSWMPVAWFRCGLAGQRTRAYQTDRDIQRGLLAGFSLKHVDFTGYVLNLDDDSATYIAAVGVRF